MALETVIYPQESFGYGCKEYYIPANLSNYNYELGLLQGGEDMTFTSLLDTGNCNNTNRESSSSPVMYNNNAKEYSCWDPNYSSIEESTNVIGDHQLFVEASPAMMEPPPATRAATVSGRRKRRRTRSCKNKEELENQRMTHIAVERNRRKQMNEYLAVIRSLMPPSYVQRGDQASIIGGAINFVKELEHHLQTLEAQKRTHSQQQQQSDCHGSLSTPLFADYFSFPRYSTRSNHSNSSTLADAAAATTCDSPLAAEKQLALAEIEVTMAESHANLKILSKRRPKQLLKMVAGLQCLWLTVLHLNVTTVDHMVLYSLSLMLEEGCQLTTADEIADVVNQLLGRVQEEAASS
ncbi:transcription factor bHLH94-like [Nicotiana tabacum]|uniref:Transcription factor bHLH94-like n=2 Tax=Nicotiana TaxID=4085 RepID=A0A1S4AT81_TOBAC|nr:PREDICTED: transcription factor bHLH94-like [Nicotiana sylvestris]XP_016479713.1 PREDICTED: transcription factor bHLH94-like [Nicotiana tabacum]